MQYLRLACMVVRLCLDIVILAHYWVAGDKLRNKLAKNITRSLSRSRQRTDDLDEETLRLQAIKRHENYKVIADLQI